MFALPKITGLVRQRNFCSRSKGTLLSFVSPEWSSMASIRTVDIWVHGRHHDHYVGYYMKFVSDRTVVTLMQWLVCMLPLPGTNIWSDQLAIASNIRLHYNVNTIPGV